jgi:hypothetical protein
MPYPFAPGEVLTSANLNAALDMRVRTDGTNLVLTPGAVLFGSSAGGFASDSTNLTFDDTNNRLGVNNNTPQAMLSVGKTAGAARVYNSYTDAANGEWGDFSWSGNVLQLGSAKNGTGIARDVVINHGSSERARVTSTDLRLTVGGGTTGIYFSVWSDVTKEYYLANQNGAMNVVRQSGIGGPEFRLVNAGWVDWNNHEWSYNGSWISNVAAYGTSRVGTGVARDSAFYHGGTQKLWLTSEGLGVGGTPGGSGAGRLLRVTGTMTTSLNTPVEFGYTLASSVTTSQYGFVNQPTFNPSGASLTTVYGLLNYALIASTAAIGISTMSGVTSLLQTNAGYTQQITTGAAFDTLGPTVSGSLPFINYYGYRCQGIGNGNGATSGSIVNVGLIIGIHTAAGAAGGTVNNYGAYLNVGTGSGAGTTNNYGLRITGNGGSGGGGTTTNYAIYADSTAPSVFTGKLGLNGTIPQVPLQMGGTFVSAGDVVIATIQTTMQSTATGSQFGFQAAPTFQPTGASLTTAIGLYANPALAGSVAIGELDAIFAWPNLTSYSGTNPTWIVGVGSEGPLGGSSTKYASNYAGFYAQDVANGHGATSGSIANHGIFVGSHTAAAAAGGTINNRGATIFLPSGSGAGTTSNLGLYLTGNGGSGGGGTTTNYAIFSDSAALSQLQSTRIGIGIANPTNATAPFLYITAAAGVPTGVPAFAAVGAIAIQWDSTNKKLMVYDQPSATWKGVVLA